MAKSNSNEALKQEQIVETVSKTEKFFNENKKTVWGAVCAVLVVALCFFAYHSFYYAPKHAESLEQMYPAEAAFAAGNYELALNGDGNNPGFMQIMEDYGNVASKIVYFYAGICELQAGRWQEAADYLTKYKGSDRIMNGRALCCLGDAYVGLEKYEDAVKCYNKAAKASDNLFSAAYLLKAGQVYEQLGNDAKALECYKTIKDQYPQSMEGYGIDKYISRIENK